MLHGFTESQQIWTNFSKVLSSEFRIITIDLPGHGESECIDEIHTMELMADVVYSVLCHCNVKKCIMIGHSMGGYVTLSFSGKYPEMLNGFGIFHSHCFADSQSDKDNRDRTINVVKQDKFSFMSQFIPGLFPEEVRGKFIDEIEGLINDAGKMSKEGVIASLEGMKVRKDQTGLLRTTVLPVLFILGLRDSKAPLDRLWDMITLPANSESLILRDVGHMGYIEAPNETVKAIRHFALKHIS